jgi:hypothetical protein
MPCERLGQVCLAGPWRPVEDHLLALPEQVSDLLQLARTPNREARAPHSVMQEQLNRDDTRLWGLLCNGTTLRLLRDSATLISQSYVEFDLRAIFEGELFSDFVLLYLACHESRFATHGDADSGEGAPESCYLEQWRTASATQGERVLDQLRKGVEQAISILGTGFIAHPSNPQLRLRLEKNELRFDDLNRALLRVVYRMLFWFVAEDRDALLIPMPGVSAETPPHPRRPVRRQPIWPADCPDASMITLPRDPAAQSYFVRTAQYGRSGCVSLYAAIACSGMLPSPPVSKPALAAQSLTSRVLACHRDPVISARGGRVRAIRMASATSSSARRVRFIASSANTERASSSTVRPGRARSSARTVSASSSRLKTRTGLSNKPTGGRTGRDTMQPG